MKSFKFGSLVLVVFLFYLSACQEKSNGIVNRSNYSTPIKVACVGNSITFGSGINHRDSLSYPAQLQRMLGDSWEVRNYGVSGRTLLSKGDRPYINEPAFEDAMAFQPDVVLIKLGTNDTKPNNWEYKDEFKDDYRNLIESFQRLDPKPIVVLLKAVPAFPERWGIRDSIIHNHMNPMVEELAKSMNLPIIDLHEPMVGHGELFPDLIHPNAEGAAIMASIIYNALIGD